MAEDPYSDLLATLKHPIRRSILRLLYDNERSFKALQDATQLESGHLAYHLKSLGELVSQTPEGRYRLTAYGVAAFTFMQNLEEPVKLTQPRWTPQPGRATGVFVTVGFLLVIGIAVLMPPWPTVIGTNGVEARAIMIPAYQTLDLGTHIVSVSPQWTIPYLLEIRDEFRYFLFASNGSKPTLLVDDTAVSGMPSFGWRFGMMLENLTGALNRLTAENLTSVGIFNCTRSLEQRMICAGRVVLQVRETDGTILLPAMAHSISLRNPGETPSTFFLSYSIDRVVTNNFPKAVVFATGLLGFISQVYPVGHRYLAGLRNWLRHRKPAGNG